MNASTTTTVILKSLDLELKALLMQDIERFKASKNNANTQSAATKQAA
nr:hypothetical protein [Mucilaginibacter sp. Bleaf8]